MSIIFRRIRQHSWSVWSKNFRSCHLGNSTTSYSNVFRQWQFLSENATTHPWGDRGLGQQKTPCHIITCDYLQMWDTILAPNNILYIRCLMVSTNQADPSCFYFRISWILMEWCLFYFFVPSIWCRASEVTTWRRS